MTQPAAYAVNVRLAALRLGDTGAALADLGPAPYTPRVSRRFRFRLVDVFTDRVLQGNPLAVVPEAEGLSEVEMQALAREMNLSETAFVLPPSDGARAAGAEYRLRIFTPAQEIPFSGHPSIGTAWILADEGRISLKGPTTEIRQEMAMGVLPVTLHVRGRGADRRAHEITMTQAAIELIHRVGQDEMEELSESLEVRGRDLRWPGDGERSGRLRMPAVISCGLPVLVVPFSSLDLLADLDSERGLDVARFAETYGADMAALVAPGNAGAIADADVHMRVLPDPRTGVVEDPASGSAAGPVGVFLGLLAHQRGATHRVVIEQGVEIGRPSRLVAEVDFSVEGRPVQARATGSVMPLAEGWLTLP
ncbi:PhzF family phenazine biosynthesis protein [soil metagenome]